MKSHMLTHTGEKPFQCEHCEKAYRSNRHLKAHREQVHMTEEQVEEALWTVECGICCKRFVYRENLLRHMSSVHRGTEHCGICNASFVDTYLLKEHYLNEHNGMRHICPYCHETFSRKYALQCHQKQGHQTTDEQSDNHAISIPYTDEDSETLTL